MDQADLDRLRFVAERYHELQGLRGVCIGSSFGASLAVALLVHWPPEETVWFTAIAVAFALIIPGMFWLDRFYRGRFGKTAPAHRFWSIANLMPAVMVPLFLYDISQFNARLGLYFLAWASFALWVTVRDWRYRSYHLLNVALGGVAAVMSPQLAEAYAAYPPPVMTGFLLIGSGMIVTGLLDHRLLTSAMPRAHAAPERRHADSV